MAALLRHMDVCVRVHQAALVRAEKQIPRRMLGASARNDIKMLFQQSV